MARKLHRQTGETQTAGQQRQSSKCPLSPKDSTEMCKQKAQNRATKGSCLWHLWFEDPAQWLESCTVRPEKRKQQVNNASLPSVSCHPKIQRRCARKRHRTVRLKAVVSGISGLKIQCNGSKAAPSDRRDANSSPRQSSKCPLSPKDSTEMCKEKAQNRATKGSCLWHLWFEDPVQWLESCTVRPERCKQRCAERGRQAELFDTGRGEVSGLQASGCINRFALRGIVGTMYCYS